MDTETKKLFQIIFQEAHVIDFDFSKWDKFIRIVVVAQLMPTTTDSRFPLYNVDFLDVSCINWNSNHLGIVLDTEDQHCQWTIFEFDITKNGAFQNIKLSGVKPSPELTILCKTVRIEEIDNKVVDTVNPDWNNPYCPLARPSLAEIHLNIKKMD